MKLILLLTIAGVALASKSNSNLVCSPGVHKVYVTMDGIELVYKKQRGSPLECKGIFILPKGYGFSIECPQASISKKCEKGGLTFKEKSMGVVGQICGNEPGYYMMKEGEEGKRCKLMVKFWTEGGKSYNSFRCSIKPYMKKMEMKEMDMNMNMKMTYPPTTTMPPTTTTSTTTTTTSTTTMLTCNTGTMIGNYCYHLMGGLGSVSPTSCISTCNGNGGYTMADVNSAGIQSELETQATATSTMNIAIGVTRNGSGNLEWINSGVEITTGYDNWDSTNSEPDNSGGSEDCAIAATAASTAFQWEDKPCGNNAVDGCFCQGPPVRA